MKKFWVIGALAVAALVAASVGGTPDLRPTAAKSIRHGPRQC